MHHPFFVLLIAFSIAFFLFAQHLHPLFFFSYSPLRLYCLLISRTRTFKTIKKENTVALSFLLSYILPNLIHSLFFILSHIPLLLLTLLFCRVGSARPEPSPLSLSLLCSIIHPSPSSYTPPHSRLFFFFAFLLLFIYHPSILFSLFSSTYTTNSTDPASCFPFPLLLSLLHASRILSC